MSISKDLFLAILSMDSYNRGYGQGIQVSGNQIGNASIETDSEEVFRDPENPEDETAGHAAGFYAIAYNLADASGVVGMDTNQEIISYRGTDNYNEGSLANDIYSGWLSGAGIANAVALLPESRLQPEDADARRANPAFLSLSTFARWHDQVTEALVLRRIVTTGSRKLNSYGVTA